MQEKTMYEKKDELVGRLDGLVNRLHYGPDSWEGMIIVNAIAMVMEEGREKGFRLKYSRYEDEMRKYLGLIRKPNYQPKPT